MKTYKKIHPGQSFGRLTVIGDSGERSPAGARLLLCSCQCGEGVKVRAAQLTIGKTKSCGCLQREHRRVGFNSSHGDTNSAEYITWMGMRRRCEYPKNNRFESYGARGISVCERWHVYEHFLNDMGRKPSPDHSIDRIDVNGNYEPGNCRWATPKQQAQNRRPKAA